MKRNQAKNYYWFQAVPDWLPLKKSKNSSLRMAVIVGDRLYQGLKFEGELLLLTKNHWKCVLNYGNPDFLLVELSHPEYSHSQDDDRFLTTSNQNLLNQVIQKSQKYEIPTVAWITHGYEDAKLDLALLKTFDLVCCANEKLCDILYQQGIDGKYLPPCVQPALFNPFNIFEQEDSKSTKILCEYINASKLKDDEEACKQLMPFGLKFINTTNICSDSLSFAIKNAYLGALTEKEKAKVLKLAKAYIVQAKDILKTEQEWLILEAAASRLNILYQGKIELAYFIEQFVTHCQDEEEIILECFRMQKDPLYGQRISHRAWRYVNLHHTFSHRLKNICSFLGLDMEPKLLPRVSVIIPCSRKKYLNDCIRKYNNFKYKEKELILVLNGIEYCHFEIAELQIISKDIKILKLPSDQFAGSALNLGSLHASGDYRFRVDDDDEYGENYITDMVLGAKSIDADLFGKYPVGLHFEGHDGVYIKNKPEEFTLIPNELLLEGKAWLAGNSMAEKTSADAVSYIDTLYGAADTGKNLTVSSSVNFKIAMMDTFNLIANRRSDLSSHTWKDDVGLLMKERQKLDYKSDLFL